MSGNNNAGFTLIEVLISTIVLSAVIYLATFSYSLFLDSWEKNRFIDASAIQQYRSHLLVRDAVESIFDYYVTEAGRSSGSRHFPFFKGDAESFEFVTLSSVFEKGKPAAARIRLVKEGDEKLKTLIYEEASLSKTYIRYEEDRPEYKKSIVLYRQVVQLRIRYYGAFEFRFVPERDDFVTEYKWQETFDGKQRSAAPKTIEITLETPEGKIKLVFHVKTQDTGKLYFFNPEAG